MRRRNRTRPPYGEQEVAGHAHGKQHVPPAPDEVEPHLPDVAHRHDQPWLPLRTLVGRVRRSTRRQ